MKTICHRLTIGKADGKQRDVLLAQLEILTSAFSEWCASVLRRRHTAVSSNLFRAILEDPVNWWKHLRNFEQEANGDV